MVRNQEEFLKMRDDEPELTIGRVASGAGVNVETIRYYQRRGLIEEPKKAFGKYRHYPQATVKRIRFIKKAQEVGFTLKDVAQLLRVDSETACATIREYAAQKVTLIGNEIFELKRMHTALSRLVRECDKQKRTGPCPIIEMFQR
jgi:MerR family transcriptional regulator, mercuric resistance operon regulatory protein